MRWRRLPARSACLLPASLFLIEAVVEIMSRYGQTVLGPPLPRSTSAALARDSAGQILSRANERRKADDGASSPPQAERGEAGALI